MKKMISLAMCKTSPKTLVLSLLMLVLTMPAFAQELVKGVVIDSSGESVIGASVFQKDNRKNGTVTDIDGNFSLKMPGGKGTVIVSYIGMKQKEVKVRSDRLNRITL